MKKISEILNEVVEKENKPKQLEIGTYHPSMISSCLRKQYLSYKPTDALKQEPELLKIFRIGHVMHEHLQQLLIRYFKESDGDIRVVSEGKVSRSFKNPNGNEFTISGSFDLMIGDILYEFKTRSSIKYYDTAGRLVEPDKPSDEHYMQIQCYLNITGTRFGKVIYVDKRNFETLEFDIEMNSHYFDGVVLPRFSILHEHLLAETVPKAERFNTYECKNCVNREHCQKLEGKKLKE